MPTSLLAARRGSSGPAEVERVVRIDPQRNGVVRRAEVVAVLLVPVLAVADRDELRQVVVERPEAVVDPRAQRWESRRRAGGGRSETAVARRGCCRCVHIERTIGQSIDVSGDVRQPVAHLDAAFAVLLEADLQRIERVPLVAVAVGHHEPFDRQASWDSATSANGVSAIVLPAYCVSMGLGSKLSMWLMPPFMNSQMTLLALGAQRACRRAVPTGLIRDAVALEHRAEGDTRESELR